MRIFGCCSGAGWGSSGAHPGLGKRCCEREKGCLNPPRLRAEAPGDPGEVEPQGRGLQPPEGAQAGAGGSLTSLLASASAQALWWPRRAWGWWRPSRQGPGCRFCSREKSISARAGSWPPALAALGGNWTNSAHLQGTETTRILPGFVGKRTQTGMNPQEIQAWVLRLPKVAGPLPCSSVSPVTLHRNNSLSYRRPEGVPGASPWASCSWLPDHRASVFCPVPPPPQLSCSNPQRIPPDTNTVAGDPQNRG